MKKVSIIGAGNVGATAAMNIARMNIVDTVVLLDIKEGVAEGKAMDISQCAASLEFTTDVIGVTNDYSATADTDVFVVTSGMARKPGMTREDLVGVNSRIMQNVIERCHRYSKDAIYIIVSNPMDTMTYQSVKILEALGKTDVKTKVFGMGGMLDTSRFKYFIKEKLNKHGYEETVSVNDIDAYVIGAHSDINMVPVIDKVTFWSKEEGKTIYLKDVLSELEIADIIDKTKRGGAILTGMLGTSAWEAPAACIAYTVKAIIWNEMVGMPCSIYRDNYDCCIGTFSFIGKDGILGYDNIESELEDKTPFIEAVNAVKKVNEALPKND